MCVKCLDGLNIPYVGRGDLKETIIQGKENEEWADSMWGVESGEDE